MRTVTKTYEIFKFNELSESAKENVKRWFLDHQEAEFFTEQCKQDLENLFGKNYLNVQYSLGYCQGDGFNIYGCIDAKSVLNCLEKHNGGSQLEKFENMLTEKEKRTILFYAEECCDIYLPYNSHYCYSLSHNINIANSWQYDLEDYANINTEVLEKFENMVKGIFKELCNYYEKDGYEYFYEISDEDLEDVCNVNDYEFLEDGTIFLK